MGDPGRGLGGGAEGPPGQGVSSMAGGRAVQSKDVVPVHGESLPGAGWGWGHTWAALWQLNLVRRGLSPFLSPCGSEAGLSARSRPDQCGSDLHG